MHRNRMLRGTALNLLAVGFNQGSTLIVNIVVARILMKHAFGEYTMVQSTLLTGSVLSQLALGYTASKYIAEFRSQSPAKACQVMGSCVLASGTMAIIGTLAFFLVAPWLAETVLKAPHLGIPLRIGVGFLFFSAINGYQTGALAGLEAFSRLANAGIASGIIAVIAISFAAYIGGLNGALFGLSVSALFRTFFHHRELRSECAVQKIKPVYSMSLYKDNAVILKFALPAAVAGYYSMPMIWLANSILIRQPDGYGEMALFSAANNIRMLVLFLPNVMNSVGLSILNNKKAKGNAEIYTRIFKTNIFNIFIVSLSSVIVMGVIGGPILIFFGKQFEDAQNIFLILLIVSFLECLSMSLYQYLQSHAKIWHGFFVITIPRDGFLVLSTYFLVPSHGGIGLAAAYLGSTILGFVLTFCLVATLFGSYSKKLDLHSVGDGNSFPV